MAQMAVHIENEYLEWTVRGASHRRSCAGDGDAAEFPPILVIIDPAAIGSVLPFVIHRVIAEYGECIHRPVLAHADLVSETIGSGRRRRRRPTIPRRHVGAAARRPDVGEAARHRLTPTPRGIATCLFHLIVHVRSRRAAAGAAESDCVALIHVLPDAATPLIHAQINPPPPIPPLPT